MGIFFSKNKKQHSTPFFSNKDNTPFLSNKEKMKLLIQHYEFIKFRKQIYDVDAIVDIIENTDWENTPMYFSTPNDLEPSAPPSMDI